MRTFTLTDEEARRAAEWDQKHILDKHGGTKPYSGAIGGRLVYSFVSTGLGQIASVKCGLCDESYTLTDFSSW